MTDFTSEHTGLDTLDDLIAVVAKGGNVDVLNRLLEERRDAEHRAAREAYLAAMAAVPPETFRVVRDATGARQGQKYASLDAILSHVRPPLLEAGITIGFDSSVTPGDDDRITYICELSHTGGYTHKARAPVTREAASNRMNATQRDGSAQTYGMRYALLLALGIATGEDDDGRAAAGPPALVTEEQADHLRVLSDDLPNERIEQLLAWAGTDVWAGVPSSKYAACVSALERASREGSK